MYRKRGRLGFKVKKKWNQGFWGQWSCAPSTPCPKNVYLPTDLGQGRNNIFQDKNIPFTDSSLPIFLFLNFQYSEFLVSIFLLFNFVRFVLKVSRSVAIQIRTWEKANSFIQSSNTHSLRTPLGKWIACAALCIAHKYFNCAILSELHRVLTGSEAPNEWMTGSEFSSLAQC